MKNSWHSRSIVNRGSIWSAINMTKKFRESYKQSLSYWVRFLPSTCMTWVIQKSFIPIVDLYLNTLGNPPSLKVDRTFMQVIWCLKIWSCSEDVEFCNSLDVILREKKLFSWNTLKNTLSFIFIHFHSPSSYYKSIPCRRSTTNRQLSWRSLPARHWCRLRRWTPGRCSRPHWPGRQGDLRSSCKLPLL